MDDLSFVRGLAFIDSFFPSGSYAYSYGLEGAVHDGIIKTGRDLEDYLKHWLKEGVSRSDAIAVLHAHHAVQSKEIKKALQADRRLEAMKTCRETRKASRQMGRQVIRIGADRLGHPLVLTFDSLVEKDETPGHSAVGMGMVLGACGWPSRMTVVAYLYQAVTGWISAALRLLPIGQREGQRLIHSLLPLVNQLSQEVEGLGLEEMASWAPLHEIQAMRHARLEVRLFRS